MAFNIDDFKETGLNPPPLRKCLFEMEIDGFSKLRYLINELDLSYTEWDGWKIKCNIYENELFETYDAIKTLCNATSEGRLPMAITFYATDGKKVRSILFDIDGVTFEGDFGWDKKDKIHNWNVEFYVRETTDNIHGEI